MSKNKIQKECGYYCTYVPLEILDSFGLEPRYAIGSPTATDISQAYLNPNICGFARALCSRPRSDSYDMIFTDCCDAMFKLYEAWHLHSDFADDYAYMLSFPRVVNDRSIDFWQNVLQHFITSLEEATGRKFSETSLKQSIKRYNRLRRALRQAEGLLLANKISGSAYLDLMIEVQEQNLDTAIDAAESFLETHADAEEQDANFLLLVSGSHFPAIKAVAEVLEDNDCNAVYFDTCNTSRSYNMIVDEGLPPLEAIARGYLQKVPCPRMKHSSERLSHVIDIVKTNNIDGVIYHTLKFCDPHIFDYSILKKHLGEEEIPFIRLETNHEFNLPGQMQTRIEAFAEML